MTASPIACTLAPGALRSRAADLLSGLASIAGRRIPLPDGVRLEFAPLAATLRHIGEVIERELRCCRFLDFRLDTRTPTGAIALEVTGPAGTGEFLARLLAEPAAA